MKSYDFILKFSLPNKSIHPREYTDKLFEAGCDDALVGIGKKGYIALNFTRDSENGYKAITSAIENVKKAIPGARLIEVGPDFVGLSDIAQFLGCSRQNMRNLIINNIEECPPPIYDGSTSLWRLSKILAWLTKKDYQIEETLLEISKITILINILIERNEIKQVIDENKQFSCDIQGLLV